MPIVVKDANSANQNLATVTDENSELVPKHVLVARGSTPTLFSRYLDTAGNGTGTKNATGNYSAGVTDFYTQPAAGQVFRVTTLTVSIIDNNAFDEGKYGSLTALTNGYSIELRDASSTLVDFTDGIKIKSIAHLQTLFRFGQIYDIDAAGTRQFTAHLNFDVQCGAPLRLVGSSSHRLTARLNDNFSALVEHYFICRGFVEPV